MNDEQNENGEKPHHLSGKAIACTCEIGVSMLVVILSRPVNVDNEMRPNCWHRTVFAN